VESILATLGLNLPAFLWHSANFLLLLFLLWRVLYKPVTGMLDERARRVRESLERAEEVRRQAEQAEADRKTLLAETRREAEQIRARAEEQANARAEIEAGRRQMEADLRAQMADLVVMAVDRVTRRALDTQAHRTLIQQFLTTDSSNGSSPAPKG
jgi:F-type H+-transporting ATPase subunit b